MPTSRAAITPIVFCASLAPWPNETAPAETSCSTLNGRALSGSLNSFCEPATRYIARKATVNATNGEAMIATAVFCTEAQSIASIPPADRPAPTSPPMSAWLDDEGIPTHQVA